MSYEYSEDNLYKLMTRVKPSLIRVDADEVTYPLHIIMRFEIEEAIINGNMRAFDLPDLWNSLMQEYLGLSPDNARGSIHGARSLFKIISSGVSSGDSGGVRVKFTLVILLL